MKLYARVAEVSVEKYRESIGKSEKDLLAIEEPLEIHITYYVRNQPVTQVLLITMRTPGDDAALCTGFLFTEGIISSHDDIEAIEERKIAGRDKPFTASLEIRLKPSVSFDPTTIQRDFFSTSSCGICGSKSIDNLPKNVTEAAFFQIPASVLVQLPKQLQAGQTLFQHTGGLHAAVLLNPEGNLICLCEDIGRHNALDKLIGHVLKNDRRLFSKNLVLFSGRVSYELMQKTLAAGIPFVASIGAPSSLAVEIARKHNITLIGFLRDNRFNVYAGAERIV